MSSMYITLRTKKKFDNWWINASNSGFPRMLLRNYMSSGAIDKKKKHLLYWYSQEKKFHWFTEIGVPLNKQNFKRSKIGLVLQNEVKLSIRKVLFLRITRVTLFSIKVIQYVNSLMIQYTQCFYSNHTYALPLSEKSFNPACLNFPLAKEYCKYVENKIKQLFSEHIMVYVMSWWWSSHVR
jgi:hypothetical protein